MAKRQKVDFSLDKKNIGYSLYEEFQFAKRHFHSLLGAFMWLIPISIMVGLILVFAKGTNKYFMIFEILITYYFTCRYCGDVVINNYHIRERKLTDGTKKVK